MTTDTLGARSSRGGNGAVYCAWMARYEGLMPRFASTRPNAQSAICAPPVNQSSVHEKTKHPAAPDSKPARTIIVTSSAWCSSPSRMESAPNSVRTSGLSSAMFCSRLR